MVKRDTEKYELYKGRKLVYVGITNDSDRRINEHSKDKDFDFMYKVGAKVTRANAEKWETERINTYKINHKGEIPPLNKTANGK